MKKEELYLLNYGIQVEQHILPNKMDYNLGLLHLLLQEER